jgi:hypothetical protein
MKTANKETLRELQDITGNATEHFNNLWFSLLTEDQQKALLPALISMIVAIRREAAMSQIVHPQAFLGNIGEKVIQLIGEM